MGSGIDMIDGECVPESTKRMSILNQYDAAQLGRRADILIYESYQSVDIEYAVVEFKTHSASESIQEYQQAKNIRTNATILNGFISLTKDATRGCVYMDWSGQVGYMVELFKFEDVYVAHHIAPLHLPLSLIELDEFRSDLTLLYKWRNYLAESSQIAKLGLVQSKRKYDTISISSPTTPNISPNRSPLLLPVDVYFSPSKTKKAKAP